MLSQLTGRVSARDNGLSGTDFGRRWACGLWRAPVDDEDAVSFSVNGVFVIEPRNPNLIEEFVTQVRTRVSPDETA